MLLPPTRVLAACKSLGEPFVERINEIVNEWKPECVSLYEFGTQHCARNHGAKVACLPVLGLFLSFLAFNSRCHEITFSCHPGLSQRVLLWTSFLKYPMTVPMRNPLLLYIFSLPHSYHYLKPYTLAYILVFSCFFPVRSMIECNWSY